MEKYEPVRCLDCGVKISILSEYMIDEAERQRARDALRVVHKGVCAKRAPTEEECAA